MQADQNDTSRSISKNVGPLLLAFLAFLALVVVCAASFFIAIIVWNPLSGLDENPPPRKFDEAVWKSPGPVEDERRRAMAEDLIDSKVLDGLSRAEAEHLLGPDDGTTFFPNWDMAYKLGVYGLDREWLILRFGQDGCVSEYLLTAD
jgi:hypothetical protein